jgi:hypothetical protein
VADRRRQLVSRSVSQWRHVVLGPIESRRAFVQERKQSGEVPEVDEEEDFGEIDNLPYLSILSGRRCPPGFDGRMWSDEENDRDLVSGESEAVSPSLDDGDELTRGSGLSPRLPDSEEFEPYTRTARGQHQFGDDRVMGPPATAGLGVSRERPPEEGGTRGGGSRFATSSESGRSHVFGDSEEAVDDEGHTRPGHERRRLAHAYPPGRSYSFRRGG